MNNASRALSASPRKQVCGDCPYKPQHQRSDADHGMFWAIIDAACKNWPEDHPFRPTGVNQEDRKNNLYGWLLVEVGYVDVGDVESHEVYSLDKGLHAARRHVKGKKLHYWRLVETASGWQLITPRSLDKENAGKRRFEEVRSKVYELIEVVLGQPIETLKRGSRMAA